MSVMNFGDFFFFLETTRLCPFPFAVWKTCTENIELSDLDGRNVLIEKGVKIILPLNALHAHPDFYANPEKFDPTRFDESTGGVKRLKDDGVFMPFGHGPRQCLGRDFELESISLNKIAYGFVLKLNETFFIVGMRFAVAEIKAALYTLVDKFEFSINPKSQAPNSPTGMLFFSQNTAELIVSRLKQ